MRQFIKQMFSEWGSGVTGGLSAPLFLLAFMFDTPTPRLLSASLAVGCLYFASYRVWLGEHLKYVAEESKNSLPRFKGRLYQVSATITDVSYNPTGRVDTTLKCIMSVHNDSPTPSAIINIVLTIADVGGKVYQRETPIMYSSEVPAARVFLPTQTLARGDAEAFELSVQIEGARPNDINRDSLKIRLVDAFSGDHFLSV